MTKAQRLIEGLSSLTELQKHAKKHANRAHEGKLSGKILISDKWQVMIGKRLKC